MRFLCLDSDLCQLPAPIWLGFTLIRDTYNKILGFAKESDKRLRILSIAVAPSGQLRGPTQVKISWYVSCFWHITFYHYSVRRVAAMDQSYDVTNRRLFCFPRSRPWYCNNVLQNKAQAQPYHQKVCSIGHFIVMCSVTWPLNTSEVGGDLALIQSSLPFLSHLNVI